MLKNKVAVITGSTSGIGKGIAESLAEAGVNLVLNGLLEQAEGEKIASEMAAKYGVKVIYCKADISKPDEIVYLINMAVSEFDALDILVNNAGVQHVAPIADFPDAKWDMIIAINLTAAFHTIKHGLPLMQKSGYGRIINIASAHALVASPFKSAYVAAKHGIAGLTKTVALEAAQTGVTVNAICPGYVWTPLVEGQVADTAKARGISEQEVINEVLLKAQPTKKFTTVEQIGDLVKFLCSDAAQNITGTILPVDGGWTCQ
jgi:3-hydroxybutyrate dehydrogenase